MIMKLGAITSMDAHVSCVAVTLWLSCVHEGKGSVGLDYRLTWII